MRPPVEIDIFSIRTRRASASCVRQGRPVAIRRQTSLGVRQDLRIAIEAEQADALIGFEQGGRVAARPHRSIDDEALPRQRLRKPHVVQDLLDHDRFVDVRKIVGARGHPRLSSTRAWRRAAAGA